MQDFKNVNLRVTIRNEERRHPAGAEKWPTPSAGAVRPELPSRLTIEDFLTDENRTVHEGEYWTDGPVGREII